MCLIIQRKSVNKEDTYITTMRVAEPATVFCRICVEWNCGFSSLLPLLICLTPGKMSLVKL